METAPAQRQAAILFADIAGSTRLYETLGDVEALATITRALDPRKEPVFTIAGDGDHRFRRPLRANVPSAS